MKSDRTKKCIKYRNLFLILSTLLWVGCAVFSIVSAFSKGFNTAVDSSGMPIVSEELKSLVISIGTTLLILLVLSIFMRNKVRMTVWMISLILSTIVYGENAMYCIFAAWFVDEYICLNLYKHYKIKASINKEIDARE